MALALRFEFELNPTTNDVELWYKNLRAQEEYWNDEPVIMLPHGSKPLSELKVATCENDLGLCRHLRSLAKLEAKFMKIFDLQVPTLQHLLGDEVKEHWQTWFHRFTETGPASVWNAEKGRYIQTTVSKLKDDLSSINTHMQMHAKPIRQLAVLCVNDQDKPAYNVKKHTVPPVAPIKVHKKGWDSVNKDLDEKFLSAFISGASDLECVRAARNVLKKAVMAVNPAKTKSKQQPKQNKSQEEQLQAKAMHDLAETDPQMALKIADQSKLEEEEFKTIGIFGVTKIEWYKTVCGAHELECYDYYVGIEWDPSSLLPDESQQCWQSITASDYDEHDLTEELKKMMNHTGASDVLIKHSVDNHSIWVPAEIVEVQNAALIVVYDLDADAAVQKADKIHVGNLEHCAIAKADKSNTYEAILTLTIL